MATVVESLALSRPEKVNPGRSECRRRKIKDAHDEDHAQLYPLSYSSSSLTGTATLVSPPAFRRLLAENMAPLAGSAGAKSGSRGGGLLCRGRPPPSRHA